MKVRYLAAIILAVIAAHAAVFGLLANKKVLPKRPYVAPSNFSGTEALTVDESTGRNIRVREFTVSTQLALPATGERAAP
jgi:hypothetical protein